MQIIKVSKKYDNKKLDTFLFDSFSGLSMNTFYKALRKKDIRVNNVRISENVIIHTNDEIKIFVKDNLLFKNIDVSVVFEDDNILVVFKPTNIEVVGNNSLTDILSKKYEYIAPCHRLDRNTAGLVLFAKNEDSLNILLSKFKNQEIEKHYITKVFGIPSKETNTMTAYLFKDRKKSMVYISDLPKAGYSKIITSYTLLEKDTKKNTSILDVELHTGRTHQIRAHLAHINLPIIGDGKYGVNKINKEFGVKKQILYSYILKFRFTTPAGILNYLNGISIVAPEELIDL